MKSSSGSKLSSVLALCFILVLSSGIGFPAAASDQIVLRFAGNLPVNHFITRNQESYAKQVEAKAKGKVKIQIYPAGQLFWR